MVENGHAYNSVWQLRGDLWCRLDEAADRLNRPDTVGERRERYLEICRGLITELATLEPYWLFRVRRVSRDCSAVSAPGIIVTSARWWPTSTMR